MDKLWTDNWRLAAFRHGDNDDVEQEYDRLRDLARAEAEKRNRAFDRVSTHLPAASSTGNAGC